MKKWILLLSVLIVIFLSAYRLIDGQWTLVPSTNTPAARSECGLAAANGKLYLIGGDGPAMPVEIYDPATSTWTKGATAPLIMHHFQPVSLGEKIYVLDAFSDRNYPN